MTIPALTAAPALTDLRAAALRFLLELATAHDLPLPTTIYLDNYSDSLDQPRRSLRLHLDDELPNEVQRWATALGIAMAPPLPVRSGRRTWTTIRAWSTGYDPAADWPSVEVTSYCDRHETPDDSTADHRAEAA
jgi:hypothetical protein